VRYRFRLFAGHSEVYYLPHAEGAEDAENRRGVTFFSAPSAPPRPPRETPLGLSAHRISGTGIGALVRRDRAEARSLLRGLIRRPHPAAVGQARRAPSSVEWADGSTDRASGCPHGLLPRVSTMFPRSASPQKIPRCAPCRTSIPLPFPTVHAGSYLLGQRAFHRVRDPAHPMNDCLTWRCREREEDLSFARLRLLRALRVKPHSFPGFGRRLEAAQISGGVRIPYTAGVFAQTGGGFRWMRSLRRESGRLRADGPT
jgi:hypothetical protein